jgi:anti-anti-sigma factor
MTSVIPAPTRPAPRLPVARTPEPDGCATPLHLHLDLDAGDAVVLRVRGEVDLLTVAHLRAHLDTALADTALADTALADTALAAGPRAVVVDLQGVSFIDCTGIGLLLDAGCRARRRGVRLRIVPGRAVARVAALLDLTAALGLDGPDRSAPERPAPVPA